MSQISQLVAFAKADTTNDDKEINFGIVPNYLAQQINQFGKVKVNGGEKVLTTYGVSHIFKEHGEGTKQGERGQKDITPADLEFIPLIFREPDEIQEGKKNRRGHESFKLLKKINGFTYCIIVSLIHKKGNLKLHVDTMFAKK